VFTKILFAGFSEVHIIKKARIHLNGRFFITAFKKSFLKPVF